MQLAGLVRASSARELSTRMPSWATCHRSGGGTLSKYLLRLFVTGASSRSGTAIANLRRICEQELEGQYELEIIDVLEYPELAEDEKILATPTLIKSLPLPLRRVIGDLSNTEKVLLGLEVRPQQGDAARDRGDTR
jgi:circadian clock protein KaiB